jgi:sortase A
VSRSPAVAFTAALDRYVTCTKAGAWVARLEAPTIALCATVVEGSDDGTLMRGAGHTEDTAFPGDLWNIGIAGHRDTIFRPVRKLRIGDALILTTATRVFRYRISETAIVNPEDVYVLDPTDHPTMTLVNHEERFLDKSVSCSSWRFVPS